MTRSLCFRALTSNSNTHRTTPHHVLREYDFIQFTQEFLIITHARSLHVKMLDFASFTVQT